MAAFRLHYILGICVVCVVCIVSILVLRFSVISNRYANRIIQKGRLAVANSGVDADSVRIKYWFFCVDGSATGRYSLYTKMAVLSAKKNTNLRPVAIVWGSQPELEQWLRAESVLMYR
jgi:hypothetical protein